jgi:putative ABC transport system substrate-binding protein
MGQVRRRQFLIAAGALLASPNAESQQAPKAYRIGWLSSGSPSSPISFDALRQGLRDLGYVEGRNITFDARWTEGNAAAAPALARSLVERKVDLIVAQGTPQALAAMKATATIPIVFARVAFPDKTGLVASLARPGGNVTGTAFVGAEYGKRLELLREVSPRLARGAILYPDKNPASILALEETRRWAKQFGIALESYGVHRKEDFEAAFAAIARNRPDALMTTADPLLTSYRREIVEVVVKQRLLSIFPLPEYVELGGLMSYGESIPDMARQTARYVDRILKGARPADLPVEQPTKFLIVINRDAAKSLGLTIPQSVLAVTDRFIE